MLLMGRRLVRLWAEMSWLKGVSIKEMEKDRELEVMRVWFLRVFVAFFLDFVMF